MASSVEPTPAQGLSRVSRVLVVDDDPEMRAIPCEVLSEEGYVAEEATDGVDAVRSVASRVHFDLIRLDLRMPNMDGYQFLEHRLVDQSLRQMPVIVVSATVDGDIDAPTVQTMRKPFDLAKLLRLIRRELSKPVVS